MKKLLILLVPVFLIGCESTLSTKTENYKRASEMAINPDCIELQYKRDGSGVNAIVSFEERRCAGAGCVCE